jgi:hypothetical protein
MTWVIISLDKGKQKNSIYAGSSYPDAAYQTVLTWTLSPFLYCRFKESKRTVMAFFNSTMAI